MQKMKKMVTNVFVVRTRMWRTAGGGVTSIVQMSVSVRTQLSCVAALHIPAFGLVKDKKAGKANGTVRSMIGEIVSGRVVENSVGVELVKAKAPTTI